MQTLTVEDMRRIVSGGEQFLLIDVRDKEPSGVRSLPQSIRIPFSDNFVSAVLDRTGGLTSPVVVYGDRQHSAIVGKAAEALTEAGLGEVWSYDGDAEAWIAEELEARGRRHNVVSNPDEAHAERQADARDRR